jgi:biotin carboxyl carrier protein
MEGEVLKVNSGGFEFEFTKAEIDSIEILKVENERIDILYNNQLISGYVNAIKTIQKGFKVGLGNEFFEIKIKSDLEQTLDKMGLNSIKLAKLKVIKAPMPGLVIEINAKENQELNTGDKLLILEAMKMENVLKIPHQSTVKKILVKVGQAVEKGQILMELA